MAILSRVWQLTCCTIAFLLVTVVASPVLLRDTKATTVFQFQANGTWIENIAIRPVGDLLLTRMDEPELWTVNPTDGSGSLVHRFEQATALMGITHLHDDRYAVVPTPGSFSLLTVNLAADTPHISPIVAIPEAGWLNGLTRLDDKSRTLLVADSVNGAIWKVKLSSGQYEVALSGHSLEQNGQPLGGGERPPCRGNDGILYLQLTQLTLPSRLQCSRRLAAGSVETVIASDSLPDDFALASDGTEYLMANANNQVQEAFSIGELSTLAGSKISWLITGPTAGQVSADGSILYVVTCGGHIAPPNGRLEPARVVALKQ